VQIKARLPICAVIKPMAARWPEPKIRKVMGENWLRLLAEVWGG